VNNEDNGSSRSINSNSNNNKDKYGINAKKILVTSVVLVFLLSSTVLNQNQAILLLSSQQQQQQDEQSSSLTPPPPSLSITSLAYAEKIKIKNKSLINDISNKVIKNNDSNDNDELQSILQQIQTQISLIAGQDKATNAIKQIRSVLEQNPNGPLAQSLLFLAKQQAAGNIEGVNKVTTEVARYAATGDTDGILFVLAQAVGGGAEGSPSPQKQQQIQPSLQSLPSASTSTTFFSNNSNSDIINEPSSLSSPAQLPQITTSQLAPSSSPQLPWLTSSPSSSSSSPSLTGLSSSQSLLPPYNNPEQQQQQQIQQPQPPLEQQQQQIQQPQSSMSPSPSTYPTIDLSTYNNRNNATDANTAASDSNPHSTIKVTSIDQPAMSSYSQLQSSQYTALQSSENHISRLSNSVGNYYDISSLIVNAGTSVILNGDSSHDPDGDPIGFKWEQISGPRVTLNGDNTSRATFIAPNVYSNTTILFKLTVTDQNGLSDSKTVQITVIQQAA
jgi:hypothetical protein